MYNALDSRLYDLDLENLDSGRGIVMRDCRGVVRVHALQSALLVSCRKRASQGCLSVCLCAAALRPSVSPASLPSALILYVSVRRNILGCAHMQDRCAGGGFLEHAARHVTFSSSEGTGCSVLFASIGCMADEAELWCICILAGADPTDLAAAEPTGLRSR